jgi:nucleotide-binding universal stress UspA family protein
MSTLKKVLVAVDFSSCSRDALREAARIAKLEGAALSAVHSVRVPTYVPVPDFGTVYDTQFDAEFVSRAKARWSRLARDVGLDPATPCEIDVGRAQTRIREAALAQSPDLLVLGAHGASDEWRGIGTVAISCLQHCAAPVLVVRAGHSGPFRSIIACVDFTETSRKALDEAMRVAARDGAAMHVLHVYDDPWAGLDAPKAIKENMPGFFASYRSAVEKRVRDFCAPVARELEALKAQMHLAMSPDHGGEIVSFVKSSGSDLVVIGTRAKWTIHDFFMGSTAERVARDSPCSVLALKPPGFQAK